MEKLGGREECNSFHKDLSCLIYKEFLKIKKKKTNHSVFELEEDTNGQSSQKESNAHYTEENVEVHSTSIVIR